MKDSRYRRHLPHQIPNNTPLFLTWNLKGSLPKSAILELELQASTEAAQPKRDHETLAEFQQRLAKRRFWHRDQYLDSSQDGPTFLKEPALAKLVEEALLFGATERYELYAWCIMANHVHVLLKPVWELCKITQSLKGYTARQINLIHQQTGRTVWQDESYDHWTRDEEEFFRVIYYIEQNPVAAGLCQESTQWPWSSARFRKDWTFGKAWSNGMSG